MTARQLKKFPNQPDAPPPPRTPRCDATVNSVGDHDRRWREGRYGLTDTFRCTRDSVVEIDGHHYCRLHGGHVALDMLLDGRLVPRA